MPVNRGKASREDMSPQAEAGSSQGGTNLLQSQRQQRGEISDLTVKRQGKSTEDET